MSGSEEETYSIMFSSLKHPARRKILRMLSDTTMTFSQMLEALAIPSSHLTYHLENLGELVVKGDDGKYKLSSFGKASVTMMKGAEEVPDIHANRFSALPIRWKTFFLVFTIATLLFASMSFVQFATFNQLSTNYSSLRQDYEKVRALNEQLLSWSGSGNQAMNILKNVVQIDVSKYQATLISHTAEARGDLGGVIEEVSKYSLVNNVSRIELTMRFRNNHLSLFKLDQLEGLPNFPPSYTEPQSTDTMHAAGAILQRYKSASGDSYLDEMNTLLASLNGTTDELTMGNTKLKVSSFGDNAEITLQYTQNGEDYSGKRVHIVLQNHVVTELSDDWFLYSVADAQVDISKEQAIQIAKSAAISFTWNSNGTQISSFTVLDAPVSAEFYPHPKTENLTLFPYWYVTLHLDKTYPGGVNVIAVGVWGDTGEVANIEALGGQT